MRADVFFGADDSRASVRVPVPSSIVDICPRSHSSSVRPRGQSAGGGNHRPGSKRESSHKNAAEDADRQFRLLAVGVQQVRSPVCAGSTRQMMPSLFHVNRTPRVAQAPNCRRRRVLAGCHLAAGCRPLGCNSRGLNSIFIPGRRLVATPMRVVPLYAGWKRSLADGVASIKERATVARLVGRLITWAIISMTPTSAHCASVPFAQSGNFCCGQQQQQQQL